MSIQTITPAELHRMRQSAQTVDLIDVRTPAEYAEVHVEGARLLPLDTLNLREVRESGAEVDRPLYVICQSGGRANKACQKLQAAGFSQVVNVQGGIAAWEKAGLPVVRHQVKAISLERQVRIGARLLVLAGVVLGGLIHPAFSTLAGFVGAGLIVAGATDWCGLAVIMSRMPWNQRRGGTACSA